MLTRRSFLTSVIAAPLVAAITQTPQAHEAYELRWAIFCPEITNEAVTVRYTTRDLSVRPGKSVTLCLDPIGSVFAGVVRSVTSNMDGSIDVTAQDHLSLLQQRINVESYENYGRYHAD